MHVLEHVDRLFERRHDADTATDRMILRRLVLSIAQQQQGFGRRATHHIHTIEQLIVDDHVEAQRVGQFAA